MDEFDEFYHQHWNSQPFRVGAVKTHRHRSANVVLAEVGCRTMIRFRSTSLYRLDLIEGWIPVDDTPDLSALSVWPHE